MDLTLNVVKIEVKRMKNRYQLTITSHETCLESIYTGTIEEICEKSKSSKNIILAATRCTEVITKNHKLTIKKLPSRKMDFIHLYEGGYAFDAEKYTQEESERKFIEDCGFDDEELHASLHQAWARSDVGFNEDGKPIHGYSIHDKQVPRSFMVWVVE